MRNRWLFIKKIDVFNTLNGDLIVLLDDLFITEVEF